MHSSVAPLLAYILKNNLEDKIFKSIESVYSIYNLFWYTYVDAVLVGFVLSDG